MKKVLLVGFLIITAGYIFVTREKAFSVIPIFTKENIIVPTPFPFQEMTIPFLRKRSYQSHLGLMAKEFENQNYTAYLTSYLSDGSKINGLLTQPKNERPEGGYPGIVFIHGYIPPGEYQTTQKYSDYVDYLARNGFVVFKIDLRGYGKSEGEANGAYFSADYIIDTLHAYSALQTSGFVNPQKIGLWGHSMGGNVVFRSFTVKPDISAIVIWAGAVYSYSDQRTYGINDVSYQPSGNILPRNRRQQELREKYGDPSITSEFWKQVIPISFLNDLKGAIQIHHAVDDNVVNIGYSRDLISLLDKTNVDHKLYEYPAGGHNITGSSFNLAMQRTVEFYRDRLGKER